MWDEGRGRGAGGAGKGAGAGQGFGGDRDSLCVMVQNGVSSVKDRASL